MTQFKNLPVIKIGDRVTFDTDQIELFKAETSSEDKAVKQYQQLVLGGVVHTPVKLTPSYRRKLTTCFAGEDFSIYV